MSAAQQEEYLNKLRQQIQAQTIQEIMQKMNEKCFKVCVENISTCFCDNKLFCLNAINCKFYRCVLGRKEIVWTPLRHSVSLIAWIVIWTLCKW